LSQEVNGQRLVVKVLQLALRHARPVHRFVVRQRRAGHLQLGVRMRQPA
jgi:hypothetical protein